MNHSESQPKSILKAFPTDWTATAIEILILMALGAIAVSLRAILRIPLKLPGHHGLELMMIIVMGRAYSQMRWASVFSAIAASLVVLIPVLGYKDPFMPLMVALPAIVLDISYNMLPNYRTKAWFWALSAGIGYALIPTTRAIISMTTGFVYPSLLAGLPYPLLTHFAFGFVGGLTGAALIKYVRKQ